MQRKHRFAEYFAAAAGLALSLAGHEAAAQTFTVVCTQPVTAGRACTKQVTTTKMMPGTGFGGTFAGKPMEVKETTCVAWAGPASYSCEIRSDALVSAATKVTLTTSK